MAASQPDVREGTFGQILRSGHRRLAPPAALPGLSPPAVFVWGSRDRMVSPKLEHRVAELLLGAVHLRVPCAGHYYNGPHFCCHLEAMADAVVHIDSIASQGKRYTGGEILSRACVAEADPANAHAESAVKA